MFVLGLYNLLIVEDRNQDRQCHIAMDLAFNSTEEDTAFEACLVALKKHDGNDEYRLMISEWMTLCSMSQKYEERKIIACNLVARQFSSPLFVRVAWLGKARNEASRGNYKEALVFCEIALKNLEDLENIAAEGNVSFNEHYTVLCLVFKKISYKS